MACGVLGLVVTPLHVPRPLTAVPPAPPLASLEARLSAGLPWRPRQATVAVVQPRAKHSERAGRRSPSQLRHNAGTYERVASGAFPLNEQLAVTAQHHRDGFGGTAERPASSTETGRSASVLVCHRHQQAADGPTLRRRRRSSAMAVFHWPPWLLRPLPRCSWRRRLGQQRRRRCVDATFLARKILARNRMKVDLSWLL